MNAVAVATPPRSYHNGSTKDPRNRQSDGRRKPLPVTEREIVAWDMEGMNLSGDGKPQHPVLFGCSVEADNPLVAQKLSTVDMLNYIVDVAERHPQALHVGYAFKYDANMILQDLPMNAFRALWEKNHIRFKLGAYYWNVQYFSGKKLTITRSRERWIFRPDGKGYGVRGNKKGRTSVTIYDFSSFFGGTSFIKAAENILRGDLCKDDWEVIKHGKTARGSNTWNDLRSVRYYWEREIQLIARTFGRFRDVMAKAGFALKEWYGPGALANYINAAHNIRPHLAGAQSTSGVMPAEVHMASKIAFSGGRFEAFKLGRIEGPVYMADINSAYPYALTMIPSLDPAMGEWVNENFPDRIRRFGFYRIEYRAPNGTHFESRPMPLFWRNRNGLISYPNRVSGWYASPEARIVTNMPGVRILEGWYWNSDESVFPWEFLNEMYLTRQRLGKENLLSLPFKLGPNSLYGKYAQTVGWDERTNLPPKSHALPIAAWTTSMCRSMLLEAMMQRSDAIVSVETDSLATTVDPSTFGLNIGTGLGQWSVKTSDELVYLQSGMYLTRSGTDWNGVKSRGIGRTEFPVDNTIEYLKGLIPGEEWKPLRITTKPKFIGAGAALASRARFKHVHCAWKAQTKEITFGETGKRRHHQGACRACADGLTPWDGPHATFVNSDSDGYEMSHPRRLPWEEAQTEEVQAIRDGVKLEEELINA